MATINATMSISLDGVIQAPGRSDEDTRDGFERGGWAVPYGDDVMMQKMGEGMSGASAMLFGRRTYEDFAGYWPHQTDNPFTDHLNQVQKYVVSSTLTDPLPWQNSTVLPGDPAETAAELKAGIGPGSRHRRQRSTAPLPAGGGSGRRTHTADPSARARAGPATLR